MEEVPSIVRECGLEQEYEQLLRSQSFKAPDNVSLLVEGIVVEVDELVASNRSSMNKSFQVPPTPPQNQSKSSCTFKRSDSKILSPSLYFPGELRFIDKYRKLDFGTNPESQETAVTKIDRDSMFSANNSCCVSQVVEKSEEPIEGQVSLSSSGTAKTLNNGDLLSSQEKLMVRHCEESVVSAENSVFVSPILEHSNRSGVNKNSFFFKETIKMLNQLNLENEHSLVLELDERPLEDTLELKLDISPSLDDDNNEQN